MQEIIDNLHKDLNKLAIVNTKAGWVIGNLTILRDMIADRNSGATKAPPLKMDWIEKELTRLIDGFRD